MAAEYGSFGPSDYSLAPSKDVHSMGAAAYIPYGMSSEEGRLTPINRMAGEPAFCAGRHCCQWSVNGITCNNHYPSAADLDKHVATEHAGRTAYGQSGGDYCCHWAGCNKTESFGNKPKLTRHLHSHTGHKPHQCSYPGCGKGFVTKEQLKNHETTHTRTKGHVCPECGKGFAVKTALTSHMNVHKGTKPYTCDDCGKGFADSSNLSKHKAIHKRAALKVAHGRRQSIACQSSTSVSATNTPILHTAAVSASTTAFGPTYATPYYHHLDATPSIELQDAPEHCDLPCFDTHCPDTVRLPCPTVSPCRSVPCRDPTCSVEASCLGPCAEPCNLQKCHEQSCEIEHCDFAECDLADCAQWCEEHFDCFCNGSEAEAVFTTPSTQPAVPAQTVGFGKLDEHGWKPQQQGSSIGPAALSSLESAGKDGLLPQGFQRLSDFIHDCGEFCPCGASEQTRREEGDCS